MSSWSIGLDTLIYPLNALCDRPVGWNGSFQNSFTLTWLFFTRGTLFQQEMYTFGYEAIKASAGAESESVQWNESFLLKERRPQWWRIIFLLTVLPFPTICCHCGLVSASAVFSFFLKNVHNVEIFLPAFLPSASKFGVETKTIAADFTSLDIYPKIEAGLSGLEIGVLGKSAAGVSVTSLDIHFN